jgi:hypothetical protein
MTGILPIAPIAAQLGGSTALTIGSTAAGAAGAAGALGAAGAGAAAAGAGTNFMQALGTPKGFAALGQGIGVLGKAAGLMIGGDKGRKLAQSAGMFQLVSSLAPSISDAVKAFSDPTTGTQTTPGGTPNYNPGSDKLIQPGGQTNLGYMGILGNTFA